MTTILPNVWHARTVAETSSKACFICFKPTTRVLTTPDTKDFFYVCNSHLSDAGFASPIVDAEAEAAKRKKEAMDREIEKVKLEYEEKERKRKAKKKNKNKDKDGEKDKDKKKEKESEDEDAQADKERDDKINSIKKDGADGTKSSEEDAPRIYALQRHFYQMRIDRLRNLEMARRNQQRLKDPTFFPSAPKGDL